jgi:GNAT superfamily N-acetyltransferase
MLTLREAAPDDIPLILAYIAELAEYERAPEKAVAKAEDISRYMFGPSPLIHCELAQWDGKDAVFALYFFNFSTWEGRPGLYLEDLFVRPEFRSHGIGKALLKRLARIAVEHGCTRYVWQVLDWNTPSIDFYKAMGAKVMHDWLTCRVEGDALHALAEGAP